MDRGLKPWTWATIGPAGMGLPAYFSDPALRLDADQLWTRPALMVDVAAEGVGEAVRGSGAGVRAYVGAVPEVGRARARSCGWRRSAPGSRGTLGPGGLALAARKASVGRGREPCGEHPRVDA